MMLNDLVPILVLAIAMGIAIDVAEKFAAVARSWRFSVRGLMFLTLAISLALAIAIVVTKPI
jgi:hypothetical protein